MPTHFWDFRWPLGMSFRQWPLKSLSPTTRVSACFRFFWILCFFPVRDKEAIWVSACHCSIHNALAHPDLEFPDYCFFLLAVVLWAAFWTYSSASAICRHLIHLNAELNSVTYSYFLIINPCTIFAWEEEFYPKL